MSFSSKNVAHFALLLLLFFLSLSQKAEWEKTKASDLLLKPASINRSTVVFFTCIFSIVRGSCHLQMRRV